MNSGLIGGIVLLIASVYFGYEAKTENLDWTPLLNLKVWGGGLAGLGTIVYNLKDKVNLTKLLPRKTEKVGDVLPEVAELDLKALESEDLYCISYLMKRAKKANAESAIALVKQLGAEFYEIHVKEV